ncbi:MAG: hypothetical protein ACYC7F_02190 [Gemmatimonadaceae bacterium]
MALADARLRTVKLLHTIAWACFASCVVFIPFAAWQRRLGLAGMLIAAFAANLIRLPRWVRECERQMEAIAQHAVKLLSNP